MDERDRIRQYNSSLNDYELGLPFVRVSPSCTRRVLRKPVPNQDFTSHETATIIDTRRVSSSGIQSPRFSSYLLTFLMR